MDYEVKRKLNYVTTNVKSVEFEYSTQFDCWFIAVNSKRIQQFASMMGYASLRFITKESAIGYAVKKGLIEAVKD